MLSTVLSFNLWQTKYHLTAAETLVSIKPPWVTLVDVHLFAQQIGPGKGAVHLAIAAVPNALWDKREGKVMLMGSQYRNAH